MGVSKLVILALMLVYVVKVSGLGYGNLCRGYECDYGCKCRVRGHGYHKRPYCEKPKNPCNGYNKCPYGTKCVSHGNGCYKQVKCVKTNPCHSYKCDYGCKCLLSGYGYNQKPYCQKPKNLCHGYRRCPYGTKCQSYGKGCYKQIKCVHTNPCHSYKCQKGCKCLVRGNGYNKTPYCQKPRDPCHGYNVCPYGTKCQSYGHGCYKTKKCIKTNPCHGYKCKHGCKCKVRGYGYNQKAYCDTPKDPCYGYNVCPYGTKCQSYGHGCYKTKKCIKTNPCHGYKCGYGCKCRVRGYGYNQKAYCDTPKDPCHGNKCHYGTICKSYGTGCYKTAKCIKIAIYKPVNPNKPRRSW